MNLLLHIDIHRQRVKYIINEQSMNINVFLFFSFVFLQFERERGYTKFGIRRNSPKGTYLISLMEFHWRIFLLLRANRLHAIFNTGLTKMASSCLAEFLPLLLPGVLGFWFCLLRTLSNDQLCYFLFPLTERSPHFRLRAPANRLASTFQCQATRVRSPSINIWSPLWPIFFLNGHSLTACYC